MQNYQWNEMTMGTCYYPEHWDESLWAEDLKRMQKAGISVIRVAEFAWNKIEPEEGVFVFDFFDRFLDLCQEKGMKVIFGTPSATPPVWLTEKYPEVLNANIDGVLYRHGGRRHYNYNSPKYRELVSIIVEKSAEHYAKHPAIIGWQIDNELNCETDEFYSDADSKAFRKFLKKKYNSLDELNKVWGTVFWNQTYTDWDQIYVPRTILNNGYNPHLHLDYFRFVSESAVSFCRMQADIIRKYKKDGDFITTNGLFDNLDNHRMEQECLDVYTFDSYPNFAYSLENDMMKSPLKDRRWSKNLTEVRSICPHFGIMEQQSGANGWTTRMEAPTPRPGQIELWAMQSVAHGADFISFFRWRTCTFGTEMYWHGILDYDNRDNRKLKEVSKFYQKFKKLNPVCGAGFAASFAVLKDYDNEWDMRVDVWHKRIARESYEAIFEASAVTHTPYDTVYLTGKSTLKDLEKYPVLIYPHPMIMTEDRADLLKNYVSNGGTLIIGCRSAYKMENGQCIMEPQPGLLKGLTGTDIKEFTYTSPAEESVWADWNGQRLEMPVFNDVMEAEEDTKVLAVYANSFYKGSAALTEKETGTGRTIHLGSAFSVENVKMLLDYTGVLEPFREIIEAPEDIELIQRQKDGKKYLFVLNYMAEERNIFLKKAVKNLFTGQDTVGNLVLKEYEVVVFEIE